MPHKQSNFAHPSSGFTLIEAILVIALLSLLLTAITSVFVVGFKVWDSQSLSAGAKKDAAYSLRVISEELRQASSIVAATQNSLTFTADLDGNGADETIVYCWSGTAGDDLNRTEAAITKILARDAENAQFIYYDASNDPLAFPVAVSAVKLAELTLELKTEDETIKYLLKVRPRGI